MAEIILANLIDIERNQVHRRAVVTIVPAIAFKKPIDKVLGVRIFVVDRADTGDPGAMVHGFSFL